MSFGDSIAPQESESPFSGVDDSHSAFSGTSFQILKYLKESKKIDEKDLKLWWLRLYKDTSATPKDKEQALLALLKWRNIALSSSEISQLLHSIQSGYKEREPIDIFAHLQKACRKKCARVMSVVKEMGNSRYLLPAYHLARAAQAIGEGNLAFAARILGKDVIPELLSADERAVFDVLLTEHTKLSEKIGNRMLSMFGILTPPKQLGGSLVLKVVSSLDFARPLSQSDIITAAKQYLARRDYEKVIAIMALLDIRRATPAEYVSVLNIATELVDQKQNQHAMLVLEHFFDDYVPHLRGTRKLDKTSSCFLNTVLPMAREIYSKAHGAGLWAFVEDLFSWFGFSYKNTQKGSFAEKMKEKISTISLHSLHVNPLHGDNNEKKGGPSSSRSLSRLRSEKQSLTPYDAATTTKSQIVINKDYFVTPPVEALQTNPLLIDRPASRNSLSLSLFTPSKSSRGCSVSSLSSASPSTPRSSPSESVSSLPSTSPSTPRSSPSESFLPKSLNSQIGRPKRSISI